MKKWIQHNGLLLGLMTLQTVLCLTFITTFPIALDEPFSIFHSQKNLPDLWEVFRNENNPPLHFVLLHFWIKLFGTSAIAVRSLALVFSVLTIPALFKLGRKFAGKYGGVLLTGFFIFSSFHHYHAMEARVYSLFVCLFAWIVYDLYQLIFEQNNRIIWRIVLWNVALLYSHYLAGFIILCEIVILLYFFKRLSKKHWLQLFISGVVGIILFIPGIQLWLTRYEAFSSTTTWVPDAHWSELYGNILRFFNGKWAFLAIGLVVLIFLAIHLKSVKERWKTILNAQNQYLFLFFGLTYFGMYFISVLFKPIFLDRYLLYTSILLFLGIIVTMKIALRESRFYLTLILLLPMIIFCEYQPENNREPDQMASWIKNRAGVERTILICPPFYDLTFLYHHSPDIFSKPLQKEQNMNIEGIFSIYRLDNFDVNEFKRQVFFVDANARFLYPQNNIQNDLVNAGYTLSDSAQFKGEFNIWVYNR